MIYRLVYVSAATTPFSKADLVALLEKARSNNQRLGITGLLLYREGDFLQLLEGEQAAVKALYRTIERDHRHSGTIVLLEEETPERLFAEWSMGFRDLKDPAVLAMPGFSAFMNSAKEAAILTRRPEEALQLLSVFQPGV